MTTLKELIALKSEGKLKGAFHVSMKDYHAGPGVSMSQLRSLAKSPKAFAHQMQFKSTSSTKMIEGAAFDAWHGDLTPDKELFKKEYFIAEDCKDRKSKTKWGPAQERAKKLGLTAIPIGVVERFKLMSNTIKDHPIASQYLKGAGQVSFYWEDPVTGILCRCRPDYLPGNGVIADLKATDYVDLHKIKGISQGLLYYLQDAFYLWGANEAVRQQHELIGEKFEGNAFNRFLFVNVAHKEFPMDCVVTEYDDFTRSFAKNEIDKLLATLHECRATNEWPGKFDDGVVKTTLDKYIVEKATANEGDYE